MHTDFGADEGAQPFPNPAAYALTLIVRLTRRCNLRCTYCNDWRPGNSPIMSTSTLNSLLDRAMHDARSRLTHFVWHGGEPTLVPLSRYEWIVRRQRELADTDHRFLNTIQTNGTNLGPRWIEFIKRERFNVGISIDGPPELHDAARVTANGRPTYALVRSTMRRLDEARIPYAVLMVLNDRTIDLTAERIWSFLCQSGFQDVDLLPVWMPNRADPYASEPQGVKVDASGIREPRWIDFMTRLFDLWWYSDQPVRINNFASLIRKCMGAQPNNCIISGRCLGFIFGVEPEGIVDVCGLFEGLQHYRLGNIRTRTFDEMRRSTRFRAIVEEEAKRVSSLNACPTAALCSGGCPHEAFLARLYAGADAATTCCGWRPYIQHILRRVSDASAAGTSTPSDQIGRRGVPLMIASSQKD